MRSRLWNGADCWLLVVLVPWYVSAGCTCPEASLGLQPWWRWPKVPKEVLWHKLHLWVKRGQRDLVFALRLVWGSECLLLLGCVGTVRQHSPLCGSDSRISSPSAVPVAPNSFTSGSQGFTDQLSKLTQQKISHRLKFFFFSWYPYI